MSSGESEVGVARLSGHSALTVTVEDLEELTDALTGP